MARAKKKWFSDNLPTFGMFGLASGTKGETVAPIEGMTVSPWRTTVDVQVVRADGTCVNLSLNDKAVDWLLASLTSAKRRQKGWVNG